MTTQLKLYQAALRLCGERTIADLTEDREPRRLLDEIWSDGGVDACLESGQWNFATRTIQIDYDTGVTISFGYQFAFAKPSDWLSTIALSTDEYFNTPLNRYADEQDYWYADDQLLYVRYISNDASYGGNLSGWPQLFADYVGAYFAAKIIRKLTSDDQRIQEVMSALESSESKAKNHNMQNGPAKFLPQGGWTASRQGRSSSRRDRGNRGNLIG